KRRSLGGFLRSQRSPFADNDRLMIFLTSDTVGSLHRPTPTPSREARTPLVPGAVDWPTASPPVRPGSPEKSGSLRHPSRLSAVGTRPRQRCLAEERATYS